MPMANNGILIVALIFAWGVSAGDKRLMALALVSAALAYVVNTLEQWAPFFSGERLWLAVASIITASTGVVLALLQLT